jgi:hypothetical protein
MVHCAAEGADFFSSVLEPRRYRWRNEYGGLKGDQVKRLRELETEMPRSSTSKHMSQRT